MAFSVLLDENFNGTYARDDYDDILSFISSVDNNTSGNMQVMREDQYFKAKAYGISYNVPTMHSVYCDNQRATFSDMNNTVFYGQHVSQPMPNMNSFYQPSYGLDTIAYHQPNSNIEFSSSPMSSSYNDNGENSSSYTSESGESHKLMDVSSILHTTNNFIHNGFIGKDYISTVPYESLPPGVHSCNLDKSVHSLDTTQTLPYDQNRQDMFTPIIQSLNSDIFNRCTLVSFLESIRTKVEQNHDDTAYHFSNTTNSPSTYSDQSEFSYPSTYSDGHSNINSTRMLSPLSSSTDQPSLAENDLTRMMPLCSSNKLVSRNTSHCNCGACSSCILEEPVKTKYGNESNGTVYSFNNQTIESGHQTYHEEPSQQDKNKVSPFRCPEDSCSEVFKSKQGLNLHKLKKHNVGKLYKCDECEFKTPRRKDLHGHLVSQHKKLMPGMKVYECKFCSYKCVDRQRLLEHEVIHTGIKKFSCPDCGKHYTTKRGLRTHFKFHSNDRPHKCNLCEADFKVKSKLTDHLKLVHYKKGEKPFLCGYCEHKASIRGNVNQHIRNIHKGKPIIVLVSGEKKLKRTKAYNYSSMGGSGEKNHSK